MSSDRAARRGLLFVVSAPSGTGKTTVVERLVGRRSDVGRSRSYTSRTPRPGETDGVDYNFVSRSRFEEMVGRDEFLEWADIFGNLYGTARRDTEAALAGGIDLVLVIDVQGARQVRRAMPDAVAIFVLPPSFEVLARRLRGRNQDPDPAIERRLATARSEIAAAGEYDYVVVNDEIDRSVDEIEAIIVAERARRARREDRIRTVRRAFGVPDPGQ